VQVLDVVQVPPARKVWAADPKSPGADTAARLTISLSESLDLSLWHLYVHVPASPGVWIRASAPAIPLPTLSCPARAPACLRPCRTPLTALTEPQRYLMLHPSSLWAAIRMHRRHRQRVRAAAVLRIGKPPLWINVTDPRSHPQPSRRSVDPNTPMSPDLVGAPRRPSYFHRSVTSSALQQLRHVLHSRPDPPTVYLRC
jgi:hypothetical protein